MTFPTSHSPLPPADPTTREWITLYRPDAALTPEEDTRLKQLLRASFPYQPAFRLRRNLHPTPPEHRWFLMGPHEELIAHAAVYDKMITLNGKHELLIGGVAEVCVAAPYRGRGFLKEVLQTIHTFLREHDTPFAMLFGQPKVYHSSGYQQITNPVRSTNSIARHWNPFCGKPMVRLLSDRCWPEGMIDLRGPTF